MVIENYLSVLPNTLLGVEDNDIQILSPMRKGPTGINYLNKIIQQQLTANGKLVHEKKVGDEIIKFYFSLSQDQQKRRMKARKHSELKYWKLSPNDERIVTKWDAFTHLRGLRTWFNVAG